ncbi:MAG: FprA family A-type flavoprotein [Eubacteriales bacterium]
MNVTKEIQNIGVNDHKIDLFEGQYAVPEGIAYNSYVIVDGKTAVLDTVDAAFTDEWLANLRSVLGERKADYLIVQHMEPDHSGSIAAFLSAYPDAVVVATAMAFNMMKNFIGTDCKDHRIVAAEGSTLCLGRHTLTFVTAPMVHWPEVMMSYDSCDKVLFSADAFGKFGATDLDNGEDDWACEARRYYFGIVGKFGAQVQAVLKKAGALDINTICPLHGPVLTGDLSLYLNLYQVWSSYSAESEGVMVAYTSVYGNTKKAAELLADKLTAKGCPKVVLCDLARSDWAEAVEDAFRYGKLVLATTTYCGDIFPIMKEFIQHLTERGYQNRTVGLIENGSWAPLAAKIMKGMFEGCKNLTFAEPVVTVKSALNEASEAQIEALADAMM